MCLDSGENQSPRRDRKLGPLLRCGRPIRDVGENAVPANADVVPPDQRG